MKIITAAILASLLSVAVYAAKKPAYVALSGSELLDICATYGTAKILPHFSRKQGICEGYIAGVAETVAPGCIAETTEKHTIVETVRAYIKRHPDQVSNPASELVSEAVIEGWHCHRITQD